MSEPSQNSLQRAWKIQEDASILGFDWPDIGGPLAKVREELAEIEEALSRQDVQHAQSELGDLFFAVVNIARFLNVNPDLVLDNTTMRFSERFDYVKRVFQEREKDMRECTLEELDAVWDEAKKALG